MASDKAHWDAVYAARDEDALTWFEATPDLSLQMIHAYLMPADAILDVGGGTCRLVDALLADGYGDVTVLDLSDAALAISRDRLGARAASVHWIAADITTWHPDRQVTLWHDRAVFHFLTTREDRAAYVAAMRAAVKPGGYAIISSFALDGPETCSNLPVQRYAAETLAATLEALAPGQFRLVESRPHVHVTPKGNQQSFQISVFQRM